MFGLQQYRTCIKPLLAQLVNEYSSIKHNTMEQRLTVYLCYEKVIFTEDWTEGAIHGGISPRCRSHSSSQIRHIFQIKSVFIYTQLANMQQK